MNRSKEDILRNEPDREKGRSTDRRIIPFDQVGPNDLSLVGGKGFNLARMCQAELPIPPGFCVTTLAYEDYQRAQINGNLDTHGLPPELSSQIISICSRPGLLPVAVRSSANVEDLLQTSSAGVYETDLNLGKIPQVLASVKKCFDSITTNAAIDYRQRMGIDKEPKMAVVLQQMIFADSAGVLFTVDPLSGDRGQMVVNSVYGLGELLVGGTLTGDTYYYDIARQMVSADIGQKEKKLTRQGVVPVSPQEQLLPSLTSTQIRQIAAYGQQVEQLFGRPQDIEFAFVGDRPYILQARPITGSLDLLTDDTEQGRCERFLLQERRRIALRLAELRREGKLKHYPALLTDTNIAELLPTPTPMAFGVFTYIFAEEGAIQIGRRQMGYQLGNETSHGFYEMVAGHPYVNLEIDAKTFNVGFPLDIESYIDAIRQDPSLASYPELGLYQQKLTREEAITRFGEADGERYYQKYRSFLVKIDEYRQSYLQRFYQEIEPKLDTFINTRKLKDYASLSKEQLVAECHDILEYMRTQSCVQFVIAARLGFFSTERLKHHLTSLMSPDEAANRLNDLLSGLSASKITEEKQASLLLVRGQISEEEYMDKFGHLASNELEISIPRRRELGTAFLREIKDEPTGCVGQQAKRLEAERLLSLRLGELTDRVWAQEVEADLDCAQKYLPLRETIKYHFTREYNLLRQALLALQGKVGLEGENVFYLYPREIPSLLGDVDQLLVLIRSRQEERRLSSKLEKEGRLPSVVYEDRLTSFGERINSTGGDELQGMVVARSQHEQVGQVAIVDPESLDVELVLREIRKKEVPTIVVTRSANLGMDPIIARAGGLIMETGGLLAHGACRAREYGILATVLNGATSIFKNGDIIQMNPDGRVKIIERRREK